MATTRLILVGGFLGAGKTTLLLHAAERLSQQGKRVGLVANDQAADLVDTELFKQTGSEVEEVAGGCFCCRFPDMIAAMERLVRDTDADVLIGEPVGSCTDLSATVLQPLKELHGRQFDLAPFSVLVDGHQVRVLNCLRQAAEENRSARFPDNVLYIYEKQLEEADLIVLNKCDLLSATELADLKASLAERFPDTPLLTMSALTGDGVDTWLELLDQDRQSGRKIVAVDYDTYAAGEASLGWLNAVAQLRADSPHQWELFAKELLEGICADLRAASAEIAHLKLYLTVGSEHIVGNLTANDATLFLRGNLSPACRDVRLLVNARVHCPPDQLRAVVESRLSAVAGRHRLRATVSHMQSLFPGRPQPTHRYESIVQ
jgi:G3E family GTPase